MRIAVDAAGGDHGPAVVVVGAVDGARRFGVDLLLTGTEVEIRRALVGQDVTGIDVIVADAPETIGGDEQAAQAVRRKPRSALTTNCYGGGDDSKRSSREFYVALHCPSCLRR